MRGPREYWRRTCEEDGVLDAEELGEWCRDCGHVERIFAGVEKTNRGLRGGVPFIMMSGNTAI